MDFRLSDDQRQLQDTARAFAQGEMREIARDLEETDTALPKDQIKRYAEMWVEAASAPLRAACPVDEPLIGLSRHIFVAETEGEAIRYEFVTAHDGKPVGPCVLAGPSCDSADILYEKNTVDLPLALRDGDKIMIKNCGAYTSSYSSVGFNGFPPLEVVVL